MIMRSDGSVAPTPRNTEIREAIKQKEENMVRETIILQKVNKAHREAFKEKFPGQIEHCMRLTAERLQAILTKKPNDMTDTSTWSASAKDIHDLSHGLYYLSIINQHYPVEGD
jgi:hypothetical protein